MPSTGSRQKALRKARKTRRLVAAAFTSLENGQLTLWSVLEDPPDVLKHVDIWDVMRRSPKLGREGTTKCLQRAKVWPHITLGNLTEEERSAIRANLPERARRVSGGEE